MRCFNCNCELTGNRDICIRCGQDVRLYRRLCYLSNAYYNVGLNKARVRDLSGAVASLKMSIALDKTNIDARNLLGLCYFETGETAYALHEWVVSNNMLDHENDAAYYMKVIQGNPNRLEVISTSIKKYNYALKYAKEDGADLAIIQLKKVIQNNPRFIRAYQLLALLYMQEKQYKKAEALLRKCLKIDKGNTTARRYLSELKGMASKKGSVFAGSSGSAKSEPRQKTVAQQQAVTNDNDDDSEFDRVIIPVYTKSFRSYFATAIEILVGIVLGAGIIGFVAVPAAEKKYAQKYREQLTAYQTDVARDKVTIAELEDSLKKIRAERDDLSRSVARLEDQVNAADSSSSDSNTGGHTLSRKQQEQYDYVLALLNAKYDSNAPEIDVEECAKNLNIDDTYSEELQNGYKLVQSLYGDESDELFDKGYEIYQEADGLLETDKQAALDRFYDAVDVLSACVGLNPEHSQGVAWLGVCYHHLGKTTTAQEYYQYYLDHFSEEDDSLTHTVSVQLQSILDAKAASAESSDSSDESDSSEASASEESSDSGETTESSDPQDEQ